MISVDNMIAWTWDARPYPQFPTLEGEWGDYDNYPRGHWLQGRDWINPKGMDKILQFRYSKDGGNNWSNWREYSMGELGEYQRRIRIKRIGSGRNWVFHFRLSSPVKRVLYGAVAHIEQADG